MNEPRCPNCGGAIPDGVPPGLCPNCALQGALDLGAEEAARSSPTRLALPLSFGDYELLQEVARGGMGVVFKARQKSLNRVVAVKMILAGQFASREEVLRFRAEAESAARLQHPNIVRIFETGEYDGQPYFSMDYVEGGNLASLVREKPLPAKRAAELVRTIAEAIHYAHEQGILHRDLKPSNVLIDHADQPRVTDFGLAKRMTKESFLTVTGDVLGSPSFMPPEQAGYRSSRREEAPLNSELGMRNAEGDQSLVTSAATKVKAGRYSDVYGLGAILFYLVTGRPPFVAGNLAETLHHVLNTEPVSPRLLNPSVPPDIATICLKCLEKEPGKRYATAQDLAHELVRFLKDEPIRTRPVSRVEKAWRWCRRKPALAAVVAGLCLVLAAAFVSITWLWRRAENTLALVETVLEQSEIEEDDTPSMSFSNGGSHVGSFSRDRRKEFRLYPNGSAFLTISPQPVPLPVTFPFTPGDPYFSRPAGASTNDTTRTILLWSASPTPSEQSLVITQALRVAIFNPSGEFLATILHEHGVRVWDATTGKLLLWQPQGNDDDIISARFTADSSYLVTRSATGAIKVWNTLTFRIRKLTAVRGVKG